MSAAWYAVRSWLRWHRPVSRQARRMLELEAGVSSLIKTMVWAYERDDLPVPPVFLAWQALHPEDAAPGRSR